MTISGKKKVPGQHDAGATDQSNQALSDAHLEELAGGMMPADIAPMDFGDDDDPDVDLDAVEGSIRLRSGSNIPFVDK